MNTFRVNYERASDGSWSASALDLPVFSAASSREEAEREIQLAIRLYLDELASQKAPVSHGVCDTVTV
ncbi:MAG TPA: type II toxin-antitoxin system HicB family antitoxin [Solirubrobacteraceae bacterium]|jgi:predicted RNase H-like HicB family nuclease